jgi:hypothetical protein
MVDGPHMRTMEQGDLRLDSEGSPRLSILDPPWLYESVQCRTPETRQFASAARDTHVEVG